VRPYQSADGLAMWPLSSSAGWFPKTLPWGPQRRTGSANITLRGELSSFNTAAFVPRLAALLGVTPSEVEVLNIIPAHASKYATQAALAASRAAAQALALVPEGLPDELSSKLRAIESEAHDVAVMAQAKQTSSLALHVSAVVPRVGVDVDAGALRAELPALSAALGVEVLHPVAFQMAPLPPAES